ncbi:MAG: hypothetical protein KKA07_02500 [Bacteroidetes bacterium]|nr:hypothetical protein [Bacteroidota bacterium]MBU1717920.1 hypothetical protein [Bacteroidota bacterium]
MKKALFIICVLVIAAGMVSCKKCRTCSYTYSINGIEESEYFVEECGGKTAVDAYEADVRRSAAVVGGTVTCTEE